MRTGESATLDECHEADDEDYNGQMYLCGHFDLILSRMELEQ